MENMAKKNIKRFILFLIGFCILILGVTLILQWWVYLTILFKGIVGVMLALVGLLILAIAKE